MQSFPSQIQLNPFIGSLWTQLLAQLGKNFQAQNYCLVPSSLSKFLFPFVFIGMEREEELTQIPKIKGEKTAGSSGMGVELGEGKSSSRMWEWG